MRPARNYQPSARLGARQKVAKMLLCKAETGLL
jgi:hypothetical protein